MNKHWPKTRLGDLLIKSNNWIEVDPTQNYREVTVKLWGKGVTLRGTKNGADMGTGRRLRVSSGQFIVSRIDARNGAFGLIPESLNNAVVTNDFPVFDTKNELIYAEFLDYLSKTHFFIDACKSASEGTTNRVRLKENLFLEIVIALPSLDEQRRIIERIKSLSKKVEEAKSLRQSILDDAQAMLLSAFNEITKGAEYRSLSDVAPITRRPVEIHLDDEYPELGIRSFHKGTFFKCTSLGSEISHKKMYHIEPGDLVFSNIMAWEGAIAVAKPEDEGRIGVHRFITCVPKQGVSSSNFLCFYFQTNKGFQKIVEASPATIARNRTLSIKKLEKIEVPIPSCEQQLWFESLQAKVEKIKKAQADNQVELDALLPAILDKAFKGELLPTLKDKTKTTKPSAATILPARQLGFMDDFDRRRASIDVYILNKLRSRRDLVRTKMEKISHLIEYRHGVNLERSPIRDAFGPIDFPARIKTEEFAVDEGWYSVEEAKATRGTKYIYRIGNNIDSAIGYAEELIADKKNEIDAFIQLIAPLNARECEIVATLYSAWNDLLIDGIEVSDQKIIDEVLFNWHPSKQDISVDKWQKWLKWMKKHALVPAGEGKKIPAKAA